MDWLHVLFRGKQCLPPAINYSHLSCLATILQKVTDLLIIFTYTFRAELLNFLIGLLILLCFDNLYLLALTYLCSVLLPLMKPCFVRSLHGFGKKLQRILSFHEHFSNLMRFSYPSLSQWSWRVSSTRLPRRTCWRWSRCGVRPA